ncbi:MAG: glycosyltransferase family 39 protein [Cyanobacteria bacterium P01_H01_bin.121]
MLFNKPTPKSAQQATQKRAQWLPQHLRLTPDQSWLLLFTLAAIALWTISLGNVPLRDWDEGTYALVARELTRAQHWVYPTQFGSPFLLKPPLGLWLVAGSYQLFGTASEFAARLPMALISALGVPLLYALTRELTPHRRDAILTAGVYLTLLPVVRHGRLLMLDGIINTFLILLLFCLLKSKRSAPWASGIGLCIAAIALTKGVLVLALGGIILVFVCLDRRWSIFKNAYTWFGLALGLSLVLGWYAAQFQRYGTVFLDVHLGAQNFARVATAVEGNDGPPWYYLWELVKYTGPWLLFWPGGLWLAWRERHTTRGCLILTGTILFLGTISVMGTKLPWYVMPLYPFLALAVGWQLATCSHGKLSLYAYRLRWAFVGLAIAGVGGTLYLTLTDPQLPLLLMAVSLAVTMAWTAQQLLTRNPDFIARLIPGLYICLMLLMLSQSWVWELNEAFPVVALGRLLNAQTPPDTIVYSSLNYNRPSLDFYSDRQVLAASLDTLPQLRQTGHYLLLNQAALEALKIPTQAIVGQTDDLILIGPTNR